MGPIKIYLAGSWTGGQKNEDILIKLGVRNKLCSYAYPNQLKGWFSVISEVPKGERGSVMVDSGAFSAWNKGKHVDLDKYIAHCHAAIEKANELGLEIHIVNLDVIPGAAGESIAMTENFCKPENKATIEAAAKQGFKNLRRMQREGINPIHVFHQGEDWKWLDRMVEHVDYIGISPANDVPTKSRVIWIDSVFEYLHKHNIKVKTHGFAVHAHKMLIRYPWTSCDSASWRIGAGMGWIFVPGGGHGRPDYSKKPIMVRISSRNTEKGLGVVTPATLKELEKSGYSVEDLMDSWVNRALVNVKYFLEFEEWLNNSRKKSAYTPTNRLL